MLKLNEYFWVRLLVIFVYILCVRNMFSYDVLINEEQSMRIALPPVGT